MSYDLCFSKPRPGMKAEEVYDAAFEERESRVDNPVPPGPDDRALADALLRAGLGLEEFKRDYEAIAKAEGITPEAARAKYTSIELNVPIDDLAVYQVSIDGLGMDITIPFWDFGPDGIDVMKRALATIYEEAAKLGFVGYDIQLEKEVAAADLDSVAKILVGVHNDYVKPIYEKKPWWKFWDRGL